jgi:tetratricopeptide (TPR) repeat protein
VLNDFLLRKYSQMQNDSPAFMAALISSYEQQNLTSLLFESYYIQQDNFTQAIKMVARLPEFARQDSKMLSELAILYAYNQDFEPAVLHGRHAIFAATNDNEAYFVLLQVSLLAKDYDLSIEIIEVLMSKFNFIMGQDVIAQFDDSANFLRSDQYQQWLKKRSLS